MLSVESVTAARCHVLVLILLCLSVLAGVVFTLLRMRGDPPVRLLLLACLRCAALGLLTFALLGPRARTVRTVTLPAAAALVVDTSQSMSLPTVSPGSETRLQTAVQAARRLNEALQRRVPPMAIWLMAAHQEAAPISDPTALEAQGQTTDLRRAICDVAIAGARSAVVLFSDGADTEGHRPSDLLTLARTARLRVSGVVVGEDRPARDIAVDFLAAPRRVRAHSQFELRAAIRVQGYDPRGLRARVERDGAVIIRNLAIPAAITRPLKVALRAEAPGRYRYTVRVAPRPDELIPANNSRSALVEVIPDKPSVLLVAGRPAPEYAFLKRFLLGDPGLKPRVLVCKTPPSGFWRDEGQPAPVGLWALGDLRNTQAVLLQDVSAEALGPLRNRLRDFVQRGGGLAILGGSELPTFARSALSALLPVETPRGYVEEIFHAHLTHSSHPLTGALERAGIPFAALPPWWGRNPVAAVKPAGSVVLSAGGIPVLVVWEVGRGRVAVLLTDGTHRWVFHPDAGPRERQAFAAFWGALVDWLSAVRDDRPVVAEFDRDIYSAGTPARLLVQVTDSSFQPVSGAEVTARVHGAGGEQRIVCAEVADAPGRYEASVTSTRPGPLRATVTARHQGKRLGSDTAQATVASAFLELAESRPDPALLRALAEGTGGALTSPAHVESLASRIAAKPAVIQRFEARSRGRGPLSLGLLLLLWATDWTLRRRWGR